jgi:hypothetical protein
MIRTATSTGISSTCVVDKVVLHAGMNAERFVLARVRLPATHGKHVSIHKDILSTARLSLVGRTPKVTGVHGYIT